MSTASEAVTTYREMVADVGQPVAIRRYTGTGPARSPVDTATMAYVRYYASNELIGGIVQGDQVAIALVDTLSAILPVTTNDFLVIGAKEHAIKNPMKRVVSGVLIALEIHAKG